MKWETATADHVGGRDQQQDRVEVLVSSDGARRLLIVADGMGGHAGGALAAEAVVNAAGEVWMDGDVDAGPEELLGAICRASHNRINEIGEEKKVSPRSTVVLMLADGNEAHWAHIGDSRLYHFRDGKLVERSQDHSVVQMLVDIGKISEQEMGTHPDQNRLTQSLGGDADPEPAFGHAEIGEGDAFLLCTDGLWEMVSPQEMAEALAAPALERAARQLSELAVERAGEKSDNVSVALARYGREAPTVAGLPRAWLAFAVVGIAALIVALLLVFSFEPESPTRDAGTPAERNLVPDAPDAGRARDGDAGIEDRSADEGAATDDESARTMPPGEEDAEEGEFGAAPEGEDEEPEAGGDQAGRGESDESTRPDTDGSEAGPAQEFEGSGRRPYEGEAGNGLQQQEGPEDSGGDSGETEEVEPVQPPGPPGGSN